MWQRLALLVLVDAQVSTDLVCGEQTDTIDCREAVLDGLVFRQIDTSYTCHTISLSLLLLVTGVLRTDDAQYTLATDDLAVFTSGFDGGFDFHRFDLL